MLKHWRFALASGVRAGHKPLHDTGSVRHRYWVWLVVLLPQCLRLCTSRIASGQRACLMNIRRRSIGSSPQRTAGMLLPLGLQLPATQRFLGLGVVGLAALETSRPATHAQLLGPHEPGGCCCVIASCMCLDMLVRWCGCGRHCGTILCMLRHGSCMCLPDLSTDRCQCIALAILLMCTHAHNWTAHLMHQLMLVCLPKL